MPVKLTHKGTTVWVCATPQNDDLSLAQYKALTWVQVGKVGNPGDWGTTSNMPTYDTLDEPVTQNQKGTAKAGSMTIECASIAADAGQVLLRAFGDPLNSNNYAIKKILNDRPSAPLTGTSLYTRGVFSGPDYPGGGSDDFVLERYTVGANQLLIRENAV